MRRDRYTVYLEGKNHTGLYTVTLRSDYELLEKGRADTLDGCRRWVSEWREKYGIKRVDEWIRL